MQHRIRHSIIHPKIQIKRGYSNFETSNMSTVSLACVVRRRMVANDADICCLFSDLSLLRRLSAPELDRNPFFTTKFLGKSILIVSYVKSCHLLFPYSQGKNSNIIFRSLILYLAYGTFPPEFPREYPNLLSNETTLSCQNNVNNSFP